MPVMRSPNHHYRNMEVFFAKAFLPTSGRTRGDIMPKGIQQGKLTGFCACQLFTSSFRKPALRAWRVHFREL